MTHTIYHNFRENVLKDGDSIAVMDENRQLTYRELDKLVDTIVYNMPETDNEFVGVVMDHTVEMIASILAVLKSGAAYVPVEPSFPDDRIRFIMDECKVDFIITNSRYAHRFGEHKVMKVDAGYKIADHHPIEDRSCPYGLAYVLYTSGSTGLPKGVMVENRNVCHYVRAFRNEFNPQRGDVMLQYSVCSFDIFVEEVFTTLLSGATLAIPPEKIKKHIPALMDYVEKHKVTIISGFPYLLLEMNKLNTIPSSLRLLISGGDVLREKYITNLLPKVEIYNTYGPSETTVCCSYYHCNGTEPLPDGTYPIGKPVLGSDVIVCDDRLRQLPDGTYGEICIIGDGVSRGYIGNRKKENEAFVTLGNGNRVYRSGDMGLRRPDGNLLFFHRKDSQVMILGRRVETTEVENVLCSYPGIESGVVKAGTDTSGLSFLTAYIVPKVSVGFSLKALRRTMARFLPPYMIPEYFVRLKEMPLTPNGKVNMNALPEITKISTI